MKKMNSDEIKNHLNEIGSWALNSVDQIEREFEFKDFKASIFFVNAVAALAEKLQHHPDIKIFYNKVVLSVNTHDAGGITKKDFELASRVNSILS